MKIIAVILIVGCAMVSLCVGIIFRHDHTFRSQHIAENERMKENKIHCATSQDREARKENTNKIDIKTL